jgi:hypothetical protein
MSNAEYVTAFIDLESMKLSEDDFIERFLRPMYVMLRHNFTADPGVDEVMFRLSVRGVDAAYEAALLRMQLEDE